MPHLKPMEIFHLLIVFSLAGDRRCRSRSLSCLIAESLRHHGEVNLVLKARVLAANDEFDIVGDDADQRLDPAALALGEIAEHVMLHQILVAGMADADADAAVIVADMLGDRTQAVMAGNAAADLDPHLAGRQLDLVVKHRDVAERSL